jgi:putative peptidoglycan lipid II flippase
MRLTVPLLLLAGGGMVALAWPLTRLLAGVGQTASQGLAPIAHTLASFGPGLLGYGVAFVMTRVLFALGDVRRASLLMIAGAVMGVACMSVASAIMSPADRAAALAIGYGASQTIAAVLLTVRVYQLTGAMAPLRTLRLLAESVAAAAASVVVMCEVVGAFDPTRRQALVAFLLGGTAGVCTFAVVMGAVRHREFLQRRSVAR